MILQLCGFISLPPARRNFGIQWALHLVLFLSFSVQPDSAAAHVVLSRFLQGQELLEINLLYFRLFLRWVAEGQSP
jgi:hypothetical protein